MDNARSSCREIRLQVSRFSVILSSLVVFALGGCSLKSKVGVGDESLFSSQLPASQVAFATIERRTNDPELAQAALLARKSWPVFVRAWMRRREEPGTSFAVKVAVKEGDVTEHFWLEVTELRGDLISGKHDGDGVNLAGVHRGGMLVQLRSGK